MQKQHPQKQSKFESKARRAPAHQRHQKVDRAKDQDWKRDMLNLFGYTKDE